MSDEKHEGWKNYETWCVALFIDNHEDSYRYWKSNAKACLLDVETDDPPGTKEDAANRLATMLSDELEHEMPRIESSNGAMGAMWNDLLRAALQEVDCYEIAEHLLAK